MTGAAGEHGHETNRVLWNEEIVRPTKGRDALRRQACIGGRRRGGDLVGGHRRGQQPAGHLAHIHAVDAGGRVDRPGQHLAAERAEDGS